MTDHMKEAERLLLKVIYTSADVVCARDEWTKENDDQFRPLLERAKEALAALLAHIERGRVPDEERRLRRLLAARVAMPNCYMDDGEAHGHEHGISIDFMREPVADIDAKIRALNVARAVAAAPAAPDHSAVPDSELVPLDMHNRLNVGPAPWTDTRIRFDAFNAARAIFGTTCEDDDKRVYRMLQAYEWGRV